MYDWFVVPERERERVQWGCTNDGEYCHKVINMKKMQARPAAPGGAR
jgi:hypothetical protein